VKRPQFSKESTDMNRLDLSILFGDFSMRDSTEWKLQGSDVLAAKAVNPKSETERLFVRR
jgi:hypothetical protein